MTAKPERLISASYETETSWAEATDTWGTRLQLIGAPTIALTQERIVQEVSQQYAEEGKAGVQGVRGGDLTITVALTGHGTATTGSLTTTDLYDLLSNAIGTGNSDEVGDTVAASPTSSSTFGVTTEVYDSHNLLRVGALNDARGGAQWAAVNNGTTMTLLTALPATPNAGDQIYSALNVYPKEGTSSSDVTSSRWLVQTANNQYKLRGCFPKSVSFKGLEAGEIPTFEVVYGISWWDYASETFPDATATDAKTSSIVSNGSIFVNDVGTVTRATYGLRSWSVTIEMNTQPVMGQGAVNTYQTIVGAKRERCAAKLETVFDAEAAGTTTWGDKFDAGNLQHILVGLTVANGKSLAFYFQNCDMMERPTHEGVDGLNRVRCKWRALTGSTTTSDRAMASWRLGMA